MVVTKRKLALAASTIYGIVVAVGPTLLQEAKRSGSRHRVREAVNTLLVNLGGHSPTTPSA